MTTKKDNSTTTATIFDIFSTIQYDPILAFRPVAKGSFRYSISYEDLVDNIKAEAVELQYEKVLEGDTHPTKITGIYSLPHPIKILDTYDPFTRIIQHKIDEGTLTEEDMDKYRITDYRNPGKAGNLNNKLQATLSWLALINKGITPIGLKNLSTYINKTFLQSGVWKHEHIVACMTGLLELPNEDLMRNIEKNRGNYIKDRGIFYDKGTDNWSPYKSGETPNCYTHLTKVDRAVISRQYFHKKLAKAQQELIGVGISILKNQDSFTQISDVRLSKVTDLDRKTISRKKSARQKGAIKRLNADRPFKTEAKTANYVSFCSQFFDKSSREMCTWLGISKSTYREFKVKFTQDQSI